MNKKLKNEKSSISLQQESEKYLKGIPDFLHSIFIPEQHEKETFIERARKLRIREKERNYVMEIQRNNKIPLRPNESLKQTMIRVRLKFLMKKKKTAKKADKNIFKNLPIDPLE